MRHGYRHIPLSASQLAGRAQIRDVQLFGNVVWVDEQVIAIIAIAVLVCALTALGLSRLVRPLISLFLLELSAFCTREFQFFCHGRQAFPLLLFLFLFILIILIIFLFVVGIIVLGVTALTGRKIIRSGWQNVLRQRMPRTVSLHSLQCHSHRGLDAG